MGAFATASNFLKEERLRPSSVEVLRRAQTKKVRPVWSLQESTQTPVTDLWHGLQRFKGVLLLASTYMRHVAASGLLPEPHDLNVCPSLCSVLL